VRDPRPAIARAGTTTRRGVRAVCTPTGLRGAGTELVWFAAHFALYPLGVAAERSREQAERFTLAGLPPVQRGLLMGDVVAAGTPILMVHGLVDNRSIFTVLRRTLRRRGFGRVITLNYSPFTSDVRHVAVRLQRLVEKTCEETGYERVHVIGHSLGGVVARYYVQRMGGDSRVHTLTTLGSPHSGTHAAWLLPQRLVAQLRPGSELMRELAAPAKGCRTRFLAFWSDIDHLIVPQRNARVDHPDLPARNVLLRGVGHLSLPIDGRIAHEIALALAHLDEAGDTVAAGVTRLPASGAGSSFAAAPEAAPGSGSAGPAHSADDAASPSAALQQDGT
jgi:pimeloyl-ACP methyl ester carboxylesterase